MNLDFLHALDDIEKEKGIAKEVLIDAIETALYSAYKKDFGTKENVKVEVKDDGTVEVYSQRRVVEDEVTDERAEISLEDARNLDQNYEPGDVVEEEVTPANFGRIATQTAKQVVMQRIREAERDVIYEQYKEREGELITGTIQRFHRNNAFIDLGRTEALLPPSEQMPGEIYEMGKRIKLYVVEVNNDTKGPRILVSRTHPGLLKRLFELEVPEIFDGIVEIRGIAREAGHRSKIAVSSTDPRVDPVGACVGPKGMRVKAIVEQLNGEKIDIIQWGDDPAVLVANALNPAEVIKVMIQPEEKIAQVVVPDFQLSLAIGKEGQNARLAAKLTGWKVDIKNESKYEEKQAAQEDDEREDEPVEPLVGGKDEAKIEEEPVLPTGEPEFKLDREEDLEEVEEDEPVPVEEKERPEEDEEI